MVFYPHFNTQKKCEITPVLSAAEPRSSRDTPQKKPNCTQKNALKRSVCKKSRSGRHFACKTATAFPDLMSIYTAHTHTRGTFPCLRQLISTRRAVFLPRFPWFPVCITNFRAFLFFCCGRSMHRKPAISSTFYLLCAIGRP